MLAEQKEDWGRGTVANFKYVWGISTREEQLFQLWVSVGAGMGEAELARSTFMLVFRKFLSTEAAKVWKSLLGGVVRAKRA